jgi:ribosome-associated protein
MTLPDKTPTSVPDAAIPGLHAQEPSAAETNVPAPSPERMRDIILQSLDDDKAEDILAIDLTGKSALADTMIIATGRSARHVAAIADHVVRALKDAGLGSVKVEGLPNADWVLLDAGDVIAHVFRPEVRSFYGLERIWAPAASEAPNLRQG